MSEQVKHYQGYALFLCHISGDHHIVGVFPTEDEAQAHGKVTVKRDRDMFPSFRVVYAPIFVLPGRDPSLLSGYEPEPVRPSDNTGFDGVL